MLAAECQTAGRKVNRFAADSRLRAKGIEK
jgi:hypothetical protein